MLESDAVLWLGYSSDQPPGGAATQERWTLSEAGGGKESFSRWAVCQGHSESLPTDNLEVADAQARVLLEGKLAFFKLLDVNYLVLDDFLYYFVSKGS